MRVKCAHRGALSLSLRRMQAGVHDTCERGGLESKQTGVSTRSRGAEACVGAAGGFTFAWGTFSVADDDVAHIGVRAGMSIPAGRGPRGPERPRAGRG